MSLAGRFGLVVGALVIVAAAWAFNDRVFWIRWFSQPPGDTVLLNWQWYQPVDVIKDEPTSPLPNAGEGDVVIAQDALAAAQAYAEEFDSLAFLVAHKGVLQLEHYGPGQDRDTIIDSQSMHKGLFGVVATVALDQGFIPSLDTPVSNYIPACAEDERRAITVGQLLEMTSGLAQVEYGTSAFAPGQRLFFGDDLDGPVDGIPMVFEPGSAFDFNHVNSQALHPVLTGATGMSYAAFVREYLWDPIGGSFAQVRLDHDGGTARIFCCVQTRPMDWMRLGVMLANGGRINDTQVISSDWVSRMMSGTARNPNFGFHVWLGAPYSGTRLISEPQNRRAPVSAPFLADDVMYVEGRGGQRLYVVPSAGLVAYRAGRIDFSWDDAKIMNILLGGIQSSEDGAEGEGDG
ncbi:MAG: serine hydrolase [Alphaproteobacteria bacterium]|nr:serine hydrolase [Alphaproteobacteria bacterium]